MKKVLLFLSLIVSLAANAQNVAINNTGANPAASALLDISSGNKGILIPRVNLLSATDITTVAAPAPYLLLYNINAATAGGLTGEGLYVNTGTAVAANWRRVGAGEGSSAGWSVTGNVGTDSSLNFIGTTDNKALMFRVANGYSGRIGLNGAVAMGRGALKNFSDPTLTAFGDSALFKNGSTGSVQPYNSINNTAFGSRTLYANTRGDHNTAVGTLALTSNSTAAFNTAIGAEAMRSNTVGEFNTAVGSGALVSNISGSYNVAIGGSSLAINTTGNENIALGSFALNSNLLGKQNVALGSNALTNNYNGNYITAVGDRAGITLTNYFNNITCLGYNSGFATTPTNHVNIGNVNNVWIGGQVNWAVFSDERMKDDVKENVPGLSFITALRPVTYHINLEKQDAVANPMAHIAKLKMPITNEDPDYPGKNDIEKIVQTGFIAQEVETAAKKAGYTFSGVHAPVNGEGLYSLSYAEFVVPLVKAVQEQQAMIDEMKRTIVELKKEIDKK